MMKRKHLLLITFVIVLITLIVVVAQNREEKGNIIKVSAKAYYENKKIVIINTDTVDFVNAQLTLDESFQLNKLNLKVGESYEIWQVEFVHYNGKHYPENYRPRQFAIWCELKDGNNGYFSKRLN